MLKAALTFRSHHHQDWFFGTMVLLIVGCVAAWNGYGWLSWTWMWGHLLTVLGACYTIGFSRVRTSDVFSRDCIWYNLLMALINGGVALCAS